MEENAAFAAKFKFPYRLLCDTARSIGTDYGACQGPRDECARRISYVIGPDGTVTHAYPKVDAKTHPAEVLRVL